MMTESRTPGPVEHHETLWIPLGDGTRLAARAWIPRDAVARPVPAIVEYIPYRRRDGVRAWDDLTHPWLARHGYACLRIDIRGSGDSAGVLADEYLPKEQGDALEAIAWIAAQPWCSGAVGMMGISWGGFNSLQVAARRPPALRAIVTVCSTDDRYADDMHYMGGALLTGNLEWSALFTSIMARSPDPLVFGDDWRAEWRRRLESAEPMLATTLAHQHRDHHWTHGSVCEDLDAIACPVLTVGGWSDAYVDPVFRLLARLRVPRLGILGPWGHRYPHFGTPGPAIGFLAELRRWWDHWLKGVDTGIMAEPLLRAYIQQWIAPAAHLEYRPGRWVAEREWPSPTIDERRWFLNTDGLGEVQGAAGVLHVRSPLTAGSAGGEWCAYALGSVGPDLPLDQRTDDALAMVFETEPLAEAIDVLGNAAVELIVAADRPVALGVVRLNDVAPDGQVARATYGVFNLTHRDGHERPAALEPGTKYRIQLQLKGVGYRFERGHRLRLAIGTAYWPMVWPAPEPATLTVYCGESSVRLPVRTPSDGHPEVAFGAAETGEPTRFTVLHPGATSRSVRVDLGSGTQVVEVIDDTGRAVIDAIGVETAFRKRMEYVIAPTDPCSARATAEYEIAHRHAHGWDTRIVSHTTLSCTASEFVLEADLSAWEGEVRTFERTWSRRYPRELV